MLRSILSILAGLVVMTAASFAIEFAVDGFLMHFYPANFPNETALALSSGVLILTMAYTLVCVAFGGYLTAFIARRSPLVHAAALAALQEVLTVIAIIEKVAPAPRWAWIANLALVPLAIILGGYWRTRQR